MIALQNFMMVVVLPIVSVTAIIGLFRWWMKRSTGYDPADDERKSSHVVESSSYAPYLPPKWKDEAAKSDGKGEE